MSKLRFVYLSYTSNPSNFVGAELLGIYPSLSAAESWHLLVNGEDVPCNANSKRVLQKINKTTGQIWYVEKHVLKDGR